MASKQTTLSVVNLTGMDMTNIHISEVDNYDWDGSSRPDHNFQNVSIANNYSRCQREEINTYASSSPFRMTITFSDETQLSFRSNQQWATKKYNGFIKSTGTATNHLEVYQSCGGDSNSFYVRPKQVPDNSNWMGKLLKKKPNIQLNQLTMPGSHDAGLYTTWDCGIVVHSEWAKTQCYSIADQLKAGSRYFDFRPYYDGSKYFLAHYGSMGGCKGGILDDVLSQVLSFIENKAITENTPKQETVILKFSHTMSDSPCYPHPYPYPDPDHDPFYPKQVAAHVVEQVKNILGQYLYTSSDPNVNLATTPLADLKGKVVAVFGGDAYQNLYDPSSGIFPYHDYNNSPSSLTVYDNYSDTNSLPTMIENQESKLTNYGGYNKDYLFLLSWTLTGSASLLDIEVMAKAMANPWLPLTLQDIRKDVFPYPNIIYHDFVDPYLCQAIIQLNFS